MRAPSIASRAYRTWVSHPHTSRPVRSLMASSASVWHLGSSLRARPQDLVGSGASDMIKTLARGCDLDREIASFWGIHLTGVTLSPAGHARAPGSRLALSGGDRGVP